MSSRRHSQRYTRRETGEYGILPISLAIILVLTCWACTSTDPLSDNGDEHGTDQNTEICSDAGHCEPLDTNDIAAHGDFSGTTPEDSGDDPERDAAVDEAEDADTAQTSSDSGTSDGGEMDSDTVVEDTDTEESPDTDAGPQQDADTAPTNEDVPLGFDNRFGMGLVHHGNATDFDLTADLTGPEGFIKVIFPGVTENTTQPEGHWVDAIEMAYERDLIPVIRVAPPWGDRRVRNQADDAAVSSFTALGESYRDIVEGLPLRDGWPVWIEIHNEPNLCYEWECDPDATDDGWMGYEQIAAEYARMLRDVADALIALDDPRIKITNAGLAPGGVVRCECGGDGFEPGITSMDFISAMKDEVPDVFDRLDGWSSHPYPASGKGYGFMVPYDQAMPGLLFHHDELAELGMDLPVLITETGWNLDHGSREDVATWTVQAYQDPWLDDDSILAVMPFMLRDPGWDQFGWTAPDGTPYPVYDSVRAFRCQSIPGNCP